MPNQLTLVEAAARLKKREISSVDLMQACLRQVEKLEGRLHAFISWDAEDALRQAKACDEALARGEDKPLLGIPIAIKDVISVKDQPLNCGSKILGKFVSPYDATVIQKLRQAGAIVFGRLNMDEFAMGSSTENSAFGVTRNPWDLERIPGGSSGGSAVSVAADECIASLGSDTGGSIRQPASLCGCVGLKPTYGRVSRYGLVAFASSLDQIGPFTKTAQDAALLFECLSGHDPRDSSSLPIPAFKASSMTKNSLRGLKLGLPKEYFITGLDADVASSVNKAVREFESMGAEIVEISLPHTEYSVAVYYIIATAEASANLARFDGIRYCDRVPGEDPIDLYVKTRGAGFGEEVKRRIILGTYVLSSGYYDAYYLRAQKVRTLIRNDFVKAFEKVDAIVTPTSPTAAFKMGEKANDVLQMYLSDIFTIPVNLAGTCAMSLPAGFSASGLPIGLQLIGKPFGEEVILRAGHAFEQATEWHTRTATI
jgi:aspartyl-tRNA(Asn)/glutamyl-tRNA(Gln) amidotransferase subunit A